MKFNILDNEFTITCNARLGLSTEKNWKNHPKFRIKIKNGDKSYIFTYHSGCGTYELGKDELLYAFYCFVSDGISYANALDFDDFVKEFGLELYDADGRELYEPYRVFHACEIDYKKFNELGFNCDIQTMYEKLDEIVNS